MGLGFRLNWSIWLIKSCLLCQVTVQCTKDGQFIVVVAKAATVPKLSLDTITLLEGEEAVCAPVDSTAAYVIFQFPVSACGTTVTVCISCPCVGNGSCVCVSTSQRGKLTNHSIMNTFILCVKSTSLSPFVCLPSLTFTSLTALLHLLGRRWLSCLWESHVVILWSCYWTSRFRYKGQQLWVSVWPSLTKMAPCTWLYVSVWFSSR